MKTISTLALLCAASLAGCSAFDSAPPKLARTSALITIDVDPSLPTDGLARWRDGWCHITLRRYPACLSHEVRHCLEGNFHPPGTRNGEDCH